jgi:hypothetical protein
LIKRDKTDCLAGRLSGKGGEEYASHEMLELFCCCD